MWQRNLHVLLWVRHSERIALSSVSKPDPSTWGCLLLNDGTEAGSSYRRARLLGRKRSSLTAGTGGRRARDDDEHLVLKTNAIALDSVSMSPAQAKALCQSAVLNNGHAAPTKRQSSSKCKSGTVPLRILTASVAITVGRVAVAIRS